MGLDTRTVLVVVAAVVLGLGASILFFNRGDSGTQGTPSGIVADAETALALAPPPPETFEPIFESCAHCHQVGDGARHTSGPQLNGIMDSPAAARDYPYSAPMRESGLVWDDATLIEYLIDPDGLVPGTRMLMDGLPRAQAERIVAWLRSLDAPGQSDGNDPAKAARP